MGDTPSKRMEVEIFLNVLVVVNYRRAKSKLMLTFEILKVAVNCGCGDTGAVREFYGFSSLVRVVVLRDVIGLLRLKLGVFEIVLDGTHSLPFLAEPP